MTTARAERVSNALLIATVVLGLAGAALSLLAWGGIILADALDGTLEVTSEPGHGTRVAVRLPIRALEPVA